ncbi:MAG TPA: threonine synthase [Campylobacteraceae bacterium]|nr:threonine synthase [Campylobacteraceae bacterium]
MNFIETRGNGEGFAPKVPFSYAILHPSASYGGLYVPESLPKLDATFLEENRDVSYKRLARKILTHFGIDIEPEVIDEALALYDKFDDPENPVPVVKIEEDLFVNELYHGPTRAFKDMALQPFGHILSDLAKKRNEHYLILAATSGDTGPATLESFANKAQIRVACLYPEGGTSDVQRLQMVTEDAPNLKVIGIKGNFDDAQSALKNLLASDTFKAQLKKSHIALSAANSVNFGRIIFQIIYHVHSYLALLAQGEIEMGEKIYITVPSGNFGNALGAYYAKKMGVPIEKILITSNANNVLAQLINEGVYDIRGKKLILTNSPAMDILKSSNVERLLFDKFGPERTKEMMDALNSENRYTLTAEELALLQEDFAAIDSDDAYGMEIIRRYASKGYVMDPHTATCLKAYENLREKDLKMVICSTAEWTKFAPTMLMAIEGEAKKRSDLEALERISSKLGIPITPSVKALFEKEIVHKDVVEKEAIESKILQFIQS